MSKYEIYRWDLIMTGNSTFKSPIIYIKPDLDFLEFARANNFAVMAVIEGTGLQYDGKQIPAIVNKGCSFPNCRPNLSDATGYYVVALDSNSYGYPKEGKLGKVSFLGLVKQPEKVIANPSKSVRSVASTESDKPSSDKSRNDAKLFVVIGLAALLVLLYLLSRKLCN